MYSASWIAESLGNDKVNIGTGDSRYFSFYAIPWGHEANAAIPLCNFQSTPATTFTTMTTTMMGATNNFTFTGTMFNPRGPGCRPLTAGEMPRPAKYETLTPFGGSCPWAPATPCAKTPPLYRNPLFFTAGGVARHTLIQGYTTFGSSPATVYLGPGDPNRGKGMKGAPVEGGGTATTTSAPAIAGKFVFNFPAANPAAATDGFRRTTTGSFPRVFPYIYSYTYANLRNDAGSFGAGKGFFSTGASTIGGADRTMATFTKKVGGGAVQTARVTRGGNSFGGVMKLLGSYSTKVRFCYQGACGLGYRPWLYELIGAAGYKNPAPTTMNTFGNTGSVVTKSFTTTKTFMYGGTDYLGTPTFTIVAQRWPWTTGTVTVQATGRGPHDTFARRVGFDNRTTMGVGTVQLVSPVITQWIGATPAAMLETGGVAVMQIRFVPEPGVAVSLIWGMSLLMALKRYRA